MKTFSSKDSAKQLPIVFGIASLGGLLYLSFKHYKRSSCNGSKRNCSKNIETITNEKVEEITEGNFPEIINKYAEAFQESKIMEWILPREINDSDFVTLSSNSPYSSGQHDFEAIKKVFI